MTIDVALASCQTLPEPDPDAAVLEQALTAAGLTNQAWAWDDPAVDWSGARVVVLRSTWNYCLHLDRFLAWASGVDRVTGLHNPLAVIKWNTHKRYLLDLHEGGVPVVPTELVPQGSNADLEQLCERRDWNRVVVKPAVAAGSCGVYSTSAGNADQARFAALTGQGDVLVQPFVESVQTHGERAVVVINGRITHSIRKEPRFGGDHERVTGPHPVGEDETALVEQALAAIPRSTRLLYARVDVMHDDVGRPMISELELTEPSLFFAHSADALARMVAAIDAIVADSTRR